MPHCGEVFPDLKIETEDYEKAAAFYNRCRSASIVWIKPTEPG